MGATAVCRIELLGSGSSVSTIERLIVEQAKKEEAPSSSAEDSTCSTSVYPWFFFDEGPCFGPREGEEPPSYKRFADHIQRGASSSLAGGQLTFHCKSLWDSHKKDERRTGNRNDPFASVLLGNPRYFVDDTEEVVDETQAGQYKDLIPGRMSTKLQEALGIGPLEPPPFLFRMKQFGYPPGHLRLPKALKEHDATQVKALKIIGGRFDSLSGDQRPKEAQGPKTHLKKDAEQAYAFPGLNAPTPAGADLRAWEPERFVQQSAFRGQALLQDPRAVAGRSDQREYYAHDDRYYDSRRSAGRSSSRDRAHAKRRFSPDQEYHERASPASRSYQDYDYYHNQRMTAQEPGDAYAQARGYYAEARQRGDVAVSQRGSILDRVSSAAMEAAALRRGDSRQHFLESREVYQSGAYYDQHGYGAQGYAQRGQGGRNYYEHGFDDRSYPPSSKRRRY